jgi:glutamate carboxypeptidase
MLARLRELVEAESPSDDAPALARCADLLDGWFSTVLGARAQRPVPGQVHLLWPAADPAVLVVGHFDTVWPLGTLHEIPFTVLDGVARGPGVLDMKAGIVQLLTALEITAGRDRVSVLLTGDEETGSATSRGLIEREAVRAGRVLVCEPSADGGAVKTARKGLASYRVQATGRAAHAGLEPERGINATVEIAHQILALGDLALPGDGTTVTPTLLQGGTTSNSVPETAVVAVDVRAWTRSDLDRVDAAIRAVVPVLPGATVSVDGGVNRYPLEPERALNLLAVTQDAAHGLGLPPLEGVRSGGGSDGNLTAAVGVDTLDGLGAVGAHPHARDEWVDARAMPDRVALLAAVLDDLTTSHPTDGGRRGHERDASPRPVDQDAGARVAVRLRLASRLAGELCELSAGAWAARSHGASAAERVHVDDDLLLAEALADAWDVARCQPGPEQVGSRTGPGGTVVVVHGRDWSLVARLDGPVLVLSDHSEQVARIDGDPAVATELSGLIPELVAASRGEPPLDQTTVPPPPLMPWHRPGWSPRGSSTTGA